jgi:hypothetical protein
MLRYSRYDSVLVIWILIFDIVSNFDTCPPLEDSNFEFIGKANRQKPYNLFDFSLRRLSWRKL